MQRYPWTPLRFISFGKSWLPDLAADASAAKQKSPSSTAQPLNVQIRLMKVTLSEKRCSRRLKYSLVLMGTYLAIMYDW